MPERVLAPAALLIALLAVLLVALCNPARSDAQEPVAPPGFFGVNASGFEPGDFERMAAAGVGVTRNVFPFQVMKHGRHTPYYWGYTDQIVQQTALNGIDLIPMIYGAPPWVSEKLNRTVLKGEPKRAWDELLVALVQRYGPGGTFWQENEYTPYRPLRVWQIWNEPNSITWWGPKPSPGEYAKVLVRSANVIHSVDPEAQIMSAGIVARPTNAHAIQGKKYLKKLYANRAAVEATDILAYHPFAQSVAGVRKQLKVARKVLRSRGAGATPIWITEIGWGSKGPKGHDLIKSPAAQNRTLRDLMSMTIADQASLGLGRMLWYQWRDTTSDLCKWCETSGLLDIKSQPKELLTTFASLAVR